MRYDSDAQFVRRILGEVAALQNALERAMKAKEIADHVFDDLAPLAVSVASTLDHFTQLHTLNPQFSLSRFSANYIEKSLSATSEAISTLFRHKEFASIEEQVEWNFTHFIAPRPNGSSEHLLISVYKKISQTLDTYYAERVRNMHIAAVLNECVGWTEHINTHGHHDVHGVIIFAEKVARDNAVIDQRVELVKEICQSLTEKVVIPDISNEIEMAHTASALGQMFSFYLLDLYQALLEDLEIIAQADKNFYMFEAYCREHEIDIYEEYQNVLQAQFRNYIQMINEDILTSLELVRTANLILAAETAYKRYLDVEIPEEIVGENLSRDMRLFEQAIKKLRFSFPESAEEYRAALQKIRKFKGEIIKPAIEVYGTYLRSPQDFLKQLPQFQTRWIPILDSALACLDPRDDFYQKCQTLKEKIDQFVAKET
ncbi:hypothetical protein U14_03322 [Candidatus Moduliflexus flocculans]|uniref:Uncharacterized protein n=1 Tax=Candidatus Moduliflexus flocculans TaxID=1499966 RepID=A0A081BNV9_9BACT|nr:hypothetical protein U14_03322 [Candidatus Moduliflexus flocculans]